MRNRNGLHWLFGAAIMLATCVVSGFGGASAISAQSESQHSDLSPSEARSLIEREFGQTIDVLTQGPASALLEAERVLKILDDHTAVVNQAGEGGRALVTGSLPLRNDEDELIDNTLAKSGDVFRPSAALEDVAVPADIAGPVTVGDAGLEFGFVGIDPSASDGRLIDDDQTLFYANTQVDTDTAITTTPAGVETFTHLRSKRSPETVAMEFDLSGERELLQFGDGARVLGSDGREIAGISAPAAWDASGHEVPVTLTVVGDETLLEVKHRAGDFSYPILVDPVIESRFWGTDGYGSSSGSTTQTGAVRDGWVLNGWNTFLIPFYAWDYCPTTLITACGGKGAGLAVSAEPSNYVAGLGAWWQWDVPGGSSSYISSASLSDVLYDKRTTGDAASPKAMLGLNDNLQMLSAEQSSYYPGFAGTTASKNLRMGLMPDSSSITSDHRLVYAAGYQVQLSDQENPTLAPLDTSGVPSGWITNNSAFTVGTQVSDNGLGVNRVLSVVGLNPTTTGQKWLGWCIGNRVAPCPTSVSPNLTFNPADYPDGSHTLPVWATDALSKSSNSRTFSIKIDRVKPTAVYAGAITNGITVPRGVYPFHGAGNDATSGIWKIELALDGVQYDSLTQSCPAGGCGAILSSSVNLSGASVGPHVISVTSTDIAGNSKTTDVNFNVS